MLDAKEVQMSQEGPCLGILGSMWRHVGSQGSLLGGQDGAKGLQLEPECLGPCQTARSSETQGPREGAGKPSPYPVGLRDRFGSRFEGFEGPERRCPKGWRI